jgi:hypothetical protein
LFTYATVSPVQSDVANNSQNPPGSGPMDRGYQVRSSNATQDGACHVHQSEGLKLGSGHRYTAPGMPKEAEQSFKFVDVEGDGEVYAGIPGVGRCIG